MKFKKTVKIFIASMTGALFCALLYTVMLKLTLPPSDNAYDLPLILVLLDPFVITIGGLIAIISGLIIFPLNCILLWNRNLYHAGLFVLIIVSIEIIIVSLIWRAPVAWLLSYVTYLVAIFIVRFSELSIFDAKPEEIHIPWHSA